MRKLLGLLAVAGLVFIAAPAPRAEAAAAAPGIASTVQGASESVTTEVRWGRRRGWGRRYYAPRYYAPRFYPRRHYYRRYRW